SPGLVLARRFGLGDALLGFVWTAVALGCDPRLVELARRLVGADARRGATVLLHPAARGLDDEANRPLALALERGAGIGQLLVPAADGELPSVAAYVAPRRVRAFLLGLDEVDALVARVGGPIAAGAAPLLDDGQREAEAGLGRLLDDDG